MAVTVGSTMIASTSAAGSSPGPDRRVPKSGKSAEVVVQPVRRRANERDDHEDAPQAVDDAGDGRQQFDDVLDERFRCLEGMKSCVRKMATATPKSAPMATPRIEL